MSPLGASVCKHIGCFGHFLYFRIDWGPFVGRLVFKKPFGGLAKPFEAVFATMFGTTVLSLCLACLGRPPFGPVVLSKGNTLCFRLLQRCAHIRRL